MCIWIKVMWRKFIKSHGKFWLKKEGCAVVAV